MRRLFLFLSFMLFLFLPLWADGVACLNSSIADLWHLAGGVVDITVGEAVERGFASPEAILVDNASGRNINRELLIASEPDLIIGSEDTSSHLQLKDFMDKHGKKMILVRQDDFDDFLSYFQLFCSITGRDDLWQEHGEAQKQEINDIIVAAKAHEEKPSVLFIRAGSAFSAVRAKGTGSHFASSIISDLGAINAYDAMDGKVETLSLEALLTSDIDKILIVPQGNEEVSMDYINELFSQPGWRDIKAVREGEVYFLPKELFHFKPNGRWSEAYRMMESIIYEE